MINKSKEQETLRKVAGVLRAANEGMWVLDVGSGQLYFSPHWGKLLGYKPEEIPRHIEEWKALIHPDDKDRVLQTLNEHLQGSVPYYKCEYRIRSRSDAWVWVLGQGSVTSRDHQNNPLHVAGTTQDITERKRLEHGLKLAQFTVDWAQDAIFRIGQDARILYVNLAACQHLGYAEDELLQLSVPDINPGLSLEDWAAHWIAVKEAGWKRFETLQKRNDGTLVPVEVVANYIELDGEFIFTSFVRDITRRKLAEEEIRNLAFYDSLTNLPNRRLLLDRLDHALSISARNHQYGSLMFIDLDKFKALNDKLGHDYGDLLLIEVAKRMKSCVRENDTVARFAGDEFVVLLEETGSELEVASKNVAIVAERIRSSLAVPYQLKEHTHLGSSSIGVSFIYGHEKTIDELIKCADIAMYQAKNSGRNAVRFFEPTMQ